MRFGQTKLKQYKYHKGQMSCSKNCGGSCLIIIFVNFYILLLMQKNIKL